MLEEIRPYLNEHITGSGNALIINTVLLAGIAIGSAVAYYLSKYMLKAVEYIVHKSPTTWDDDLINDRLMRAIAQLSPAMAVHWLIPGLFGETAGSVDWLSAITSLYIVWAAVRVVTIFIDNLYQAFLHRPGLKGYAVKGIFQMFKLIVIGVGVIIGLSIIIGKSPTVILTALGASAAVLMLVFQDTILGLVASVQLTANKMLSRGDWIESAANNLDGEVLEVTLTSVKVRNWDNSVSTIPPYNLVSESFRNYEPMREDGGRRIDRAIYIDMNTVRFLSADEIEKLRKDGWLDGLDMEEAARTVNLGLLRRYLEHYIAMHPLVNTRMIYMIRQLAPTQAGLPLQLYFFTTRTEWKAFEKVQSDIFDHVYAVVRHFGLSMFQSPAGTDISRAAGSVSAS